MVNNKKNYLKLVVLGLVLSLNIAVFAYLQEQTDDSLRVSFLDVGQGDAILIEGPTGNKILLDAGPNQTIVQTLGSNLAYLNRTIDLAIVSHSDTDHLGGLPSLLLGYRLSGLMINDELNLTSARSSALLALASAVSDLPLVTLNGFSGTRIHLGNGAVLDILAPTHFSLADNDNSNDESIVILLRYGQTSFLLTGDAGVAVENKLISQFEDIREVDVLKLGHHGSKTSSSDLFLQTVKPKWAIISAGADNRYGHPHQEVITRLENLKINFLNTSEVGTIVFTSDGEVVTCETCN